MKQKQLGNSNISVSEICLGSMTWGSQTSETETHQQLDYAIGEGVNFIDTAEMYPATPRLADTTGLTEKLIGTWLNSRSDRKDLVIATKITGEGNAGIREGRRIDSQMIRQALEDSLLRLQTDIIDLYQLHWPNRGSYHFRKYWTYDASNQQPGNMDQEIADMLGEVERLQNEGKLKEFGLSNESAWGTMKFLEVSNELNLPRIVSVQNEYSLACRIFDLDMAEVCIREQIGLMSYSPLAAGGLTGKYLNGDIPADSRRSMQPNLNGRYVRQSEEVIRAYSDIARKHHINMAQMAIAFCISRPFMMSTIIGATTMEQLKINLAAKDLDLGEDVLSDIQSVYRESPMPM